ncbi:fasciclin-like arabinogalactan protein 4 [Typha angustifolia]|uniref:fasciclin-like arabinogalactan protein 4 n=1 Tax=Typha angustifolia TaxID=59011 RepID=UPI003C2DD0EA
MATFPPFHHPHFYLVSHSTPAFLFLFLLLPASSVAVNVTALLASYPDLSGFNHLLTTTSVDGELTARSSLTLLVVPNSYLLHSELAHAGSIADVLRYHVLLEYISAADLRRLPFSGKLVTTLFQTTGRAASDSGAVNLTLWNSTTAVACSPLPFSASRVTILGPVTASPYNISVFAVDGLLTPYGFDLAASESRPAPVVNVTRVLVEARGFNVAATMMEASGVAEEFEGDEKGAGVTVFVPTDEAFAGLPVTDRLQSLPAERKATVLRFHVLHSYYPLGSLESIVNPVQPTLATEETQAGRFTLNITRVNGTVAIDTGVVQAAITRTVFDQSPVAVFAVSRVLLPREMFGRDEENAAAPPPLEEVGGFAPETTPKTRVSSPPGIREDIRSGAAWRRGDRVAMSCIALFWVLLV